MFFLVRLLEVQRQDFRDMTFQIGYTDVSFGQSPNIFRGSIRYIGVAVWIGLDIQFVKSPVVFSIKSRIFDFQISDYSIIVAVHSR